MERIKKFLLIAAVALVILATITGCARMFWNLGEQEGGYIRLNVGVPGAKGIDVDYHEVTGLSITVYDPGDAELAAFEWDAEDGPQSYVVEVNSTGTHEISVTHISEDNGEVVEATETADFEIEAMVITVINITPGAIGMIEVEGEEEPIDLTGYWAGYADIPEEGLQGPHLIYLLQTGTTFVGYDGDGPFGGSVDGTDVELTFDMGEGPMTVYGTVEENGVVDAGFVWMEPLDFTCGSLVLDGFYDLTSTCGLGAKYEDEMKYSLDFDIPVHSLFGRLGFWNEIGFLPGEYPLDAPAGENDTDAFFNIDGEEYEEFGGTLVIEDGPGEFDGTFDLSFEGEDYLMGSFSFLYPNWGGATVTVTEGRWGGMDVTPGTTPGLWWEYLQEVEQGSYEIRHLDETIDVWLIMEPSSIVDELAEGSYSVPNQVSVRVSLSTVDDSEGFEEYATSGTLYITHEEDGDGIAGYFEDMMFPSGPLSGEFNVKYEISHME